ncbi:xaa-Pro dipeptidase-like [Atheta coriaria]|uniref:xaa-Pro dipeptidase-like n=1 Tax=Dalotia coriaria TaxID=877792 RepID=UPI0031F4707A
MGVFMDPLDEALAIPEMPKFINKEQVERFRRTGGVRIDDDVLILKMDVLTGIKYQELSKKLKIGLVLMMIPNTIEFTTF